MMASSSCFDLDWKIVRPFENDRWIRNGNGKKIEIAALPGSIWGREDWRKDVGFAEYGSAMNILLTALPEGRKEITIKLTVENHPQQYGEQCGALLYVSDDDYIKFVREGMKDGSVKLVLAIQEDGQPKVVGKSANGLASAVSTLQLKITEAADGARVLVEAVDVDDGGAVIGNCQLKHSIAQCALGLTSHSAPRDVESWGTFTNLQIQ